MRCVACGLKFSRGLDSAEWLSVPQLARRLDTSPGSVRGWIRRDQIAGVLRPTRSTILINRFRLEWSRSGQRSEAPEPMPPTGPTVPCPGCACLVAYEAAGELATLRELARYLKCSPAAAKKRYQRGQLPPPSSPHGRPRWSPVQVQLHYRLKMLVRELGRTS